MGNAKRRKLRRKFIYFVSIELFMFLFFCSKEFKWCMNQQVNPIWIHKQDNQNVIVCMRGIDWWDVCCCFLSYKVELCVHDSLISWRCWFAQKTKMKKFANYQEFGADEDNFEWFLFASPRIYPRTNKAEKILSGFWTKYIKYLPKIP